MLVWVRERVGEVIWVWSVGEGLVWVSLGSCGGEVNSGLGELGSGMFGCWVCDVGFGGEW